MLTKQKNYDKLKKKKGGGRGGSETAATCLLSFDAWESLKMAPSQLCYVRTHFVQHEGPANLPNTPGVLVVVVKPSTRDTLIHPALLLP